MVLQREKLILGVRSAENTRFSYDNRAFTPEKLPAVSPSAGVLVGGSSSLESRHGDSLSRHASGSLSRHASDTASRHNVPSIALAPVHLSAGRRFTPVAGPLQRVTSVANANAHVLRIKPYQKVRNI